LPIIPGVCKIGKQAVSATFFRAQAF